MTARLLALLVATIAALIAPSVSAHTVGISRGEYLWKDRTLWAGVSFARQELASALPHLLPRGGADDLIGFEDHRDLLGAWLIERLTVSAKGTPCKASFGGMRFDGDGLALAVAYTCIEAPDTLEVGASFPADLARGHRHLASLTYGDGVWEDVASTSHPELRFELASPSPPAEAKRIFFPLLHMGLEHILTGYDHLLFLLGLVLIGGPLRSLVGAVTAFTLAHSFTLALAACDVFAPPGKIIEPAIALSIAYVGVENWFIRDARGRWRLTLLFGFVHGFGFAGALREIALPRADVPRALFAFNLGVEIGQMAVLAALLPVVLAAKKTAFFRRVGMRACTATIAAAGLVWFVTRLRGGS